MTFDELRAFCLALPGATEDVKWGADLCFCVGKKMFAVTNLDAGAATGVTFKATPERLPELLEVAGIKRAAYVGRYGWLTTDNLSTLPTAELKQAVRESYDQVAAALPKKAATKTAKSSPKKKATKKRVTKKVVGKKSARPSARSKTKRRAR